MVFGQTTQDIFKQHTIRRAMDDKDYIRCGTSEGFSRPMVKPLVPTMKSENVEIPCYDFLDKVGYVAPGVARNGQMICIILDYVSLKNTRNPEQNLKSLQGTNLNRVCLLT
jgi:hypothetical protein